MSQKKVRRPVKPFETVAQARQQRTELVDFCPPKDDKLTKFIAKYYVPYRLRTQFGVVDVKISEASITRLKAMKGKRRVYTANHPSGKDPEIVFRVGSIVGEDYNYLAAREVFDEDNGKRGRLMQKLGCYSIVRGKPDRESFKMTEKLLVNNERGLVIFVEGEINRQNDKPMPCEPGTIQLSYWAIQALEKANKDKPKEKQEPLDVYLIPIGIKYRYIEDIMPSLQSSLSLLEAELKIAPASGCGIYTRLRTVCLQTLAVLQEHYGIETEEKTFATREEEKAFVNQQVEELRNLILAKVGQTLGIEVPNISTLDKLRFFRNELDEIVYKSEDDMCGYKRRLDREKAEALSVLYQHLRRVQVFIAVYDGYVEETMTQERAAELIDKLLVEFFGETPSHGKCVAYVHVGEPMNLLDDYAEFKKDKRPVTKRLADELHDKLDGSIKQADAESSDVPHLKIQ